VFIQDKVILANENFPLKEKPVHQPPCISSTSQLTGVQIVPKVGDTCARVVGCDRL
jgi:hypothetical protein